MSLYQHKPHPHKIRNVNQVHEDRLTTGQHIADMAANLIGSWNFIIVQSLVMILWVTLNGVAWFFHWDNYPYVLLNLFLSMEAALSAPVIMMSQNRQSAKDRLVAEHDYQINQKGEHEVEETMKHLDAQDQVLLQLMEKVERQEQVQSEMLKHLTATPIRVEYSGGGYPAVHVGIPLPEEQNAPYSGGVTDDEQVKQEEGEK